MHKQLHNEEIDDGTGRESKKADNKDNDDITIEHDFVLRYVGTSEEQLVMLSDKIIRTYVMK